MLKSATLPAQLSFHSTKTELRNNPKIIMRCMHVAFRSQQTRIWIIVPVPNIINKKRTRKKSYSVYQHITLVPQANLFLVLDCTKTPSLKKVLKMLKIQRECWLIRKIENRFIFITWLYYTIQDGHSTCMSNYNKNRIGISPQFLPQLSI